MMIFTIWNIPDGLRNELLQHLDEFEAAHPACQFTAFVPSTPVVSMAAFLREPATSVAQSLEHHGPPGPQLSPIERAMEALRDNPNQSDRTIAKQIGVGHQTVGRAREAMRRETAPAVVQSRNHGPRGPERGGGRE